MISEHSYPVRRLLSCQDTARSVAMAHQLNGPHHHTDLIVTSSVQQDLFDHNISCRLSHTNAEQDEAKTRICIKEIHGLLACLTSKV